MARQHCQTPPVWAYGAGPCPTYPSLSLVYLELILPREICLGSVRVAVGLEGCAETHYEDVGWFSAGERSWF